MGGRPGGRCGKAAGPRTRPGAGPTDRSPRLGGPGRSRRSRRCDGDPSDRFQGPFRTLSELSSASCPQLPPERTARVRRTPGGSDVRTHARSSPSGGIGSPAPEPVGRDRTARLHRLVDVLPAALLVADAEAVASSCSRPRSRVGPGHPFDLVVVALARRSGPTGSSSLHRSRAARQAPPKAGSVTPVGRLRLASVRPRTSAFPSCAPAGRRGRDGLGNCPGRSHSRIARLDGTALSAVS